MFQCSRSGPAELTQQDWQNDSRFVAALYESWQAQYADYLGEAEASLLMERLQASGDLLQHYEPATVVAKIGTELVGLASLRPLKGLSLITMLEVIETARGKGVGRQLVEALGENSDRLLAHVSIHRPEAMAFYVTLGFQQLERTIVDHYGHDLEFDVVAR